VGSNIEPAENVRRALQRLASQVRLSAISTFYLTEPEGRPEQEPYYNGVVAIETDLSPAALKRKVLAPLERSLGRVRTADKFAPRTIDLDIVVYDDPMSRGKEPVPADPDIARRAFLALGLQELAPDLRLPGLGLTPAQVAASFAQHQMQPLTEYSQTLRKEIGL